MTIVLDGKLQEGREHFEKCGPEVGGWWSRQNASSAALFPCRIPVGLPRFRCKSSQCELSRKESKDLKTQKMQKRAQQEQEN
jgi:hypothetical protein